MNNEFTEEEKALIARAINTEKNLLARLYGHWRGTHGTTVKAQYYTEDTTFKENTWQEQIDALNSIEEKLY